MAFLLKAMGFGDGIPNFPYRLEHTNPHTDGAITVSFLNGMNWTLEDGMSTETPSASPSSATQPHSPSTAAERLAKNRVSVFHLSLKPLSAAERSMVRNALKRVRTLRIQGLLKCLCAVEHNDHVYVATERCVPLSQATYSEDEYALGIKHITRGLHAVHLNNLVHGNVSTESVFVTVFGGFWRLFGFEMMSPFGAHADGLAPPEDPNSVYCFLRGVPLLKPDAIPRELQNVRQSQHSLQNLLTSVQSAVGLDAWGLANVILQAGRTVQKKPQNPLWVTAENAREVARDVPSGIRQGFLALAAANPSSRPRMQAFVDHCSFITDNVFVRSVDSAETYEVLETEEKERLLSTLERHLANGAPSPFPTPGSLWILTRIIHQIHMFTPRNVVVPVLLLSRRYTGNTEQYIQDIVPLIVRLYGSRDKYIRLQLLQGLPLYCDNLDEVHLHDFIWPQFAEGFRSNSPELLSLTARGAVLLLPRLPTATITNEMMGFFAVLQRSPEPGLRANATLCCAKMADFIPETSRVTILGTAYNRAVKDPEPMVRLAGVLGFQAFSNWMSETLIATVLLPHMLALTVDPFAPVRDLALRIVQDGVQRLLQHHKQLSHQTAEERPSTDSIGNSPAQVEFWNFDVEQTRKEAMEQLFGESSAAGKPVSSPPVQSSAGGIAVLHQDPAPSKRAVQDDGSDDEAKPVRPVVAARQPPKELPLQRPGGGLSLAAKKPAGGLHRPLASVPPSSPTAAAGWSDEDNDEDWGDAAPAPGVGSASPGSVSSGSAGQERFETSLRVFGKGSAGSDLAGRASPITGGMKLVKKKSLGARKCD